jgi:hypothetical protein
MAVFVRNGKLMVVDARGGVWTYDAGVTTDADGETIVAPADVAYAEKGHGDRILAIDGSAAAWTYDLGQGTWSKGLSVDELLHGEAEKTTEPWKKGHNVNTPAAKPERVPGAKAA